MRACFISQNWGAKPNLGWESDEDLNMNVIPTRNQKTINCLPFMRNGQGAQTVNLET